MVYFFISRIKNIRDQIYLIQLLYQYVQVKLLQNQTISTQMQEVNIKEKTVFIKIPEIKRFSYPTDQFTNASYNTTACSQSPFQFLRSQLQDLKPQLGLRPEKSGFTLVSVTEEELNQNNQHEITPKYLRQATQSYKIALSKLFFYLPEEDLQLKIQQKQGGLNTKNILRNICNAQNQYILFNSEAKAVTDRYLQNSDHFKAWINKLRFHTFEEFQQAWSSNKRRNVFSKLYKKLCRKFYIENAIPYIMNSRIKNKDTKLSHLRFLYRFVQGLENPKDFFYFKQKEKQTIC